MNQNKYKRQAFHMFLKIFATDQKVMDTNTYKIHQVFT